MLKKFFAPACAAVVASAAFLTAAPASAQTVLQTGTSSDGLLTVAVSANNTIDATGVNTTYTWTARNNSATVSLTGVTLGSHFGDWCGGAPCTPQGPTLISAPGCQVQTGFFEIPNDAKFGVWCTPLTGVTLQPGQTVSGSLTLRPGSGGIPDYTMYSNYNDPTTGSVITFPFSPALTRAEVVAPAPTDLQIKGAASNGSPAVGSTYSYTYEIKNAGPWGMFGGISFTDTLPASLTAVSALVSPLGASNAPNCNLSGQTVTCLLKDLQNGAAATVTVTVVASATPQQIVNSASAQPFAPQTDSNTANNSATVTVTSK